MKIGNGNDIVAVDDDDLFIIRETFHRSDYENNFISFHQQEAFLQYMETVKQGVSQMPALVLLDVNMPLIDGFELLEKIKSIPYFAELPIFIMLSNSDRPQDRENAVRLGAEGLIEKMEIVRGTFSFELEKLLCS